METKTKEGRATRDDIYFKKLSLRVNDNVIIYIYSYYWSTNDSIYRKMATLLDSNRAGAKIGVNIKYVEDKTRGNDLEKLDTF